MRDPDRIPMILAALERKWRTEPDARLGQVIVNLLRVNRNLPLEDEGRALFNIEDGELLRWLGPDNKEERIYIAEEPRRSREGWAEWERRFSQSEFYREWQQKTRRPTPADEEDA